MKKKIHDSWGRDRDTGAEGLERGVRRVKNGGVKIGGEYWVFVEGRGSWKDYEGKNVEVSVSDCWSTRYAARDMDSFQLIGYLVPKKD